MVVEMVPAIVRTYTFLLYCKDVVAVTVDVDVVVVMFHCGGPYSTITMLW